MRQTSKTRRTIGIRGQLMGFLCFICLLLVGLFWFLSTQLLEPLYTTHIQKQLTEQADAIVQKLDDAIADGQTLSYWGFGSQLYVNSQFFNQLSSEIYENGGMSSFCVDISDVTLRQIFKVENLSYCNLHRTRPTDENSELPSYSTARAMRQLCRETGSCVRKINPPTPSGTVELMVGRTTSDGSYTVLVTTSLMHVSEAGEVMSTVLPLAAALIFAFSMSAAWLFSEWFTKPLRQLSGAARQVAQGDYAVQVETNRRDELGDLAQEFNHMAKEVQHAAQMQRDLLANVSHDLRTPLTLIKGYAETVRDITGDDKAHRDEQMNIIVDEADRLTALVSSVMELSKVTSGTYKCERVHFDMGQLCDEVSERYDAVCAQNGWQLQLELPEYGGSRFAFGVTGLKAGISLVPAMVGLFGLSEAFASLADPESHAIANVKNVTIGDLFGYMKESFGMLRHHLKLVISSAVIGTVIGAIPGTGEDIASWVAYDSARRGSKEKEKFGHGSWEGLIASETANNACTSGVFIPMLTLGIAGDAVSAILLGGLQLHGYQTGPNFMTDNPNFIYFIGVLLLLVNIMFMLEGTLITPVIGKVLQIRAISLRS